MARGKIRLGYYNQRIDSHCPKERVMGKRAFLVLIGLINVLLLAACSAPDAPAVAFGDVCKSADGTRVSTEGYFSADISVYCSDTGGDYRCSYDFVEAPGSDNKFTADVLQGDGNNQAAALPDDYSDADVKIKTNDGKVIGVAQKARIQGKMAIAPDVCLMTVEKIEVAP
jgi:hypothetical protein